MKLILTVDLEDSEDDYGTTLGEIIREEINRQLKKSHEYKKFVDAQVAKAIKKLTE